MKKIFLKCTIVFALLALFCALPRFEAQAGTTERVLFEDDFNGRTFSDRWQRADAALTKEYDALRFNGGYDWGGTVCINGYRLQDYNKFVFDVKVIEYGADSWIGFAFGGNGVSSFFHGYEGYFSLRDSSVALSYFSDPAGVDVQSADGLFDKLTRRGKVETELRKNAAGKYDVTWRFLFADESTQTLQWQNLEINGGSFCFNSSGIVWDIVDFEISDGNGVAFSDDFAQSDITYPSDAPNGKWHVGNAYNEQDVFIGAISSAAFSQGNSLLVAEGALENAFAAKCAYALSFAAEFRDLADGCVFGVGVGMSGADAAPDGKAFIGVVKNDGAYEFVLVKNGQVLSRRIPTGVAPDLENGKYWPVVVRFNFDYSLEFAVGGVSGTFYDVNFNGFWCIGNLATGNASANDVRVDDLTLKGYGAVNYLSPDASNDFSGTKTDADGFEDHYVNDNLWFSGQNVLTKTLVDGTDSYVMFDNATPYSCFGSRQKYDEFVLRFRVVVTSGGANGQEFGLSFNKTSFYTNAERATAVGVCFNGYDPDNVRSVVKGNNCLTEEGGNTAEIADGTHFWRDRTTKYDFMFIVRNRSVEVYFKKASEPQSALGVLRAKFVDVNTDGYAAVYGTGGISFLLYDYNVTNLNPAAPQSDDPLREDFSDGVLSRGAAGNGKFAADGYALTSGEAIATTGEGVNGLVVFTVRSTGRFVVGFSENCLVTFDFSAGNVLFGDGNDTLSTVALDRGRFPSFDAPMTVEVRFLNDVVTVGLRKESETADCIFDVVASCAYAAPFVKGAVKLSAESDLTLFRFNVVFLDSEYVALRADYSPQDDVSPWKVKDKVAPYGDVSENRIVPVIIIVASVVAVAAAVAVVLILRKGGGKK